MRDEYKEPYGWPNREETRVALVTLALPEPPTRGGENDYLFKLFAAAGPLGWRWTTLDMHLPGLDGPTDELRAAFEKLGEIAKAASDARQAIIDGDSDGEELGSIAMRIEDLARDLDREVSG